MAIKHYDEADEANYSFVYSYIKKIKKLNDRQVNFCIYVINLFYRYSLSFPNTKEYLIASINNSSLQESQVETALETVYTSMVHDTELAWFQDDLRATIWLVNYVKQTDINIDDGYNYLQFPQLNHLNFNSKNILNIFMSKFDNSHKVHNPNCPIFFVNEKKDFLNQANQFYHDAKIADKDLKWIDTNNPEQLDWICEYLASKHMLILPNTFYPMNISDKLAQIQASLDSLYFTSFMEKPRLNFAERTLFLNKIKKAWSQKKFRDKKDDKNALQYLVSNVHIAKLEEIGKKENKAVSKVMEDIIDEYFEKNKGL